MRLLFRSLALLAVAAVLVVASGPMVMAQAPPPAAAPDAQAAPPTAQPPGGPGGPRGGRGNFDPARMREMMLQRTQEDLEATDEEWKVLSPLIEKVMDAQAAALFGGRGFGGRGGPGGPGGPGAGAAPGAPGGGPGGPGGGGRGGRGFGGGFGMFGPMTPEMEALQTVLDKKDATNEELQTALKAVRDARAKQEADLAKARQDLREVVTLRQEAKLVMSRMLD